MLDSGVHRGKDTTHKTLETMGDHVQGHVYCARAWPQECWMSGENDPTLLRYVSVITEQKKCWESLAQQFDRFQTLHDNSKQHATTCNRMRQRTQHAAFNNVASVCTGLYLPAS